MMSTTLSAVCPLDAAVITSTVTVPSRETETEKKTRMHARQGNSKVCFYL